MGAIMQERGDFDAALMKYKVVANNDPNSALLWNNIGMCFFGKQRYIAAVACLKRAFYLDPFQWCISFNLGIVHYTTEQYASAFHFFNNTINLKPDMGRAYMYLGLTLFKLDDYNNACLAFHKASNQSK
jgi:Bardet-Biedl syndrome 4 protein